MLDVILELISIISKLLPSLVYLIIVCLLILVWNPLKVLLKKVVTDKLGHDAYTYAETVFKDEIGEVKLEKALAYFNQHKSQWGLSGLSVEAIRTAIEKAWSEYN